MLSRLAGRLQPSLTWLCTQRCAIQMASHKRNTASTTSRDCLHNGALKVLHAPSCGSLWSEERWPCKVLINKLEEAWERQERSRRSIKRRIWPYSVDSIRRMHACAAGAIYDAKFPVYRTIRALYFRKDLAQLDVLRQGLSEGHGRLWPNRL